MDHTLTPVREIPANESGRGNLAGFGISCSCGLEMSNTVRTNVQADAEDHLRWAAENFPGPMPTAR